MSHPDTVVYLEHDGKVLLVNQHGIGPQLPVKGRQGIDDIIRFPTIDEVTSHGIDYEPKMEIRITFDTQVIKVIKAYPKIGWPKDWALKDNLISDNCVHPVAREAIYRSVHRLVSKVIIKNDQDEILMAKVKRGHFTGFWTLPGGYMDHDEHPAVGCVRETLEEMGINIELSDDAPIVTQRIFNREGVSFVSFTYQANWNGDDSELSLKENEISEFAWLEPSEAISRAVSGFDVEALRHL